LIGHIPVKSTLDPFAIDQAEKASASLPRCLFAGSAAPIEVF